MHAIEAQQHASKQRQSRLFVLYTVTTMMAWIVHQYKFTVETIFGI